MKKTLAAVAILGAFAGSALADVTVYGKMDMGLQYTDATDADPAWGLESGTGGASRLGLKGEEKISDDLTVGFKLEKKLLLDEGKEGDRAFDRASYIYADTNYGKFIFGRTSSIMSDAAEGMHAEVADVFGTGTKGINMAGDVSPARLDNGMMYKSPVFSGFQVGVQYASTEEGENTSKAERYYGAVAQYKIGDLALSLGADVVNRDSIGNPNVEDQYNVGLGGTYDFGFMKASVGGNYFKHANLTFAKGSALKVDLNDVDGYGVALGSKIPAFGGEIGVGLNYTSAEENVAAAREYKLYNVGTYYSYNLSKSTLVYVAASANKAELDGAAKDYESYDARAGLQINF